MTGRKKKSNFRKIWYSPQSSRQTLLSCYLYPTQSYRPYRYRSLLFVSQCVTLRCKGHSVMLSRMLNFDLDFTINGQQVELEYSLWEVVDDEK